MSQIGKFPSRNQGVAGLFGQLAQCGLAHQLHLRHQRIVNLACGKLPKDFANWDSGLMNKNKVSLPGQGRNHYGLFSSHDRPIANAKFTWKDHSLMENLEVRILEEGID